MKRDQFEAELQQVCSVVQSPNRDLYPPGSMWSRPGQRAADYKLARIADLFWLASQVQRQEISVCVHPNRAWDLLTFIRRAGLLVQSTQDMQWLLRGLAVSVLENAQYDYRDSLVSLTILRHGAELAGLNPRIQFNKAIRITHGMSRDILINARDHEPEDVTFLINAFGPSRWKSDNRDT